MSEVAFDTRTVELAQGTIRYREAGDGRPVVFVHGYLVDGRLWDGVASALADRFRCIVPDWPLGAHELPLNPDADLSPPGIARLISDFLAALELDDVVVAGNDTGGAISQILAARHPERVGALVLTNCDMFENFPPSLFKAMPPLAKVPGAMTVMGLPFQIGALRRAAFAPFAAHEIPDELTASWLARGRRDAGIRSDTRKVTAGLHKRHTLEAAERLGRFEKPALLVWAPQDRFFKLADAERLAGMLPDARVVTVADAKTFVPLDQPERVAEEIARFVSGRPG